MLEKNEWQKIEQFYQEGKTDQALALLQKLQIKVEKEGEMASLVKIYQWLIKLYQSQGQLDKALAAANKILERIENKTAAEYCDILKRRGFVYYLQGEVEKFLADVNLALKAAEENNYEPEKAACLGVLGIYYQQTERDLEKALECYQEAIAIQKKLDQTEEVAKLLINLGTLYKEMKRFAEAEKSFAQAQQLTKEKRLKINSHLELGRLFFAQGDFSKAKEEIELALKLALATEFVNEQGDCYRELARIAAQENRKEKSQEFYQKALEIYRRYGYAAKAQALAEEIKGKLSGF